MKKIFIKDRRNLQESIFSGNLLNVTENLKVEVENLSNEFPGSAEKGFIFNWFSDYDYQVVQIHFYRLETDMEFSKRQKRLEIKIKSEEGFLKKRKELYLELKKEFEDD